MSQNFGDGDPARLEDSGQDLAEYAILSALIALVVIGVLSLLGQRIAAFYEGVVGLLPFSG
ncbi:MAG TPA: Flp family type IVb pilin [Gemmatimonadota bacterium]|nr:Flp family type IVb pilin [Gemmatimonadota bacterium]